MLGAYDAKISDLQYVTEDVSTEEKKPIKRN